MLLSFAIATPRYGVPFWNDVTCLRYTGKQAVPLGAITRALLFVRRQDTTISLCPENMSRTSTPWGGSMPL